MCIDKGKNWDETPQQNYLPSLLISMPDDAMPEPEARKNEPPGQSPSVEKPDTPGRQLTDLSRLAALFSEHGGGRFSEQFSAEMALEIVLNEIVEQACLTTGASGAAIFLLRDGEMVCRASSGETVPGLGARMAGDSGIVVRSKNSPGVQRWVDLQSDRSGESGEYLKLGVRSMLFVPVLQAAQVSGLFGIFSSRVSAFAERDERTLEALTHRVRQNLDWVNLDWVKLDWVNLETIAKPRKVEQREPQSPRSPASANAGDVTGKQDAGFEMPAKRKPDLATWILGFAVFACVLFVSLRVVEHLGWISANEQVRRFDKTEEENPGQGANPLRSMSSGQNAKQSAPTGSNANSALLSSGTEKSDSELSSVKNPEKSRKAVTAEGSLRVYENGVEVFRESSGPSMQASPMQIAASVEHDAIELPPAVAQDSVAHRVEPEYPEDARQKQIEGPVVLSVHIRQDGSVQHVTLVSGDALLGEAAIAAVKQWRFKPHSVNGRLVEMDTTVTLNFRMQR